MSSDKEVPPPPPAHAYDPDASRPYKSFDHDSKNITDDLVDFKVFLLTAPALFGEGDLIKQYRLPTDEVVSCVRWNGLFYITGTDIVRSLVYRFNAFGREVNKSKKFEEGIFSDLRNLKNNVDAKLEPAKSAFLEFLYQHQCVRTKKKQKIFFWYAVPHERLFIDALERELRKDFGLLNETPGTEPPCTESVAEPSLSFQYDPQIRLYQQIVEFVDLLPTPLANKVQANLASNPRLMEAMYGGQRGHMRSIARQSHMTLGSSEYSRAMQPESPLDGSQAISTPNSAHIAYQQLHLQHPGAPMHGQVFPPGFWPAPMLMTQYMVSPGMNPGVPTHIMPGLRTGAGSHPQMMPQFTPPNSSVPLPYKSEEDGYEEARRASIRSSNTSNSGISTQRQGVVGNRGTE